MKKISEEKLGQYFHVILQYQKYVEVSGLIATVHYYFWLGFIHLVRSQSYVGMRIRG